jgi:Domain of unknown function (DUF4157)
MFKRDKRPAQALDRTESSLRVVRTLVGERDAIHRFGDPLQKPADEAEARQHEAGASAPAFDLSHVRIHADSESERLTSERAVGAFTYGRDIFFRPDVWQHDRSSGHRVLLHELSHVEQQERSGVRAVQCYSSADILPELEMNVGAEDTKAQVKRIQKLVEIFSDLPMWEAENLLKRLTARKPGDKLAAEFHLRLSTASRERLLAILQKSAVTVPFSQPVDPSKDPKYIDKVLDEVQWRRRTADRYTLVWQGGDIIVWNDEIDWTGKSKALPEVEPIYKSWSSAKAIADARRDIAATEGYDSVVAYYRGQADVVLPTWISPETAPETYKLILGLNADIRAEASELYDFFRGLRNGMIIGAVVGAALSGAVRLSGGGGGGGGGGEVEPPVSGQPAGGATGEQVSEPPSSGPQTGVEPGTATPPAEVVKPPAETAKPPAETARPAGRSAEPTAEVKGSETRGAPVRKGPQAKGKAAEGKSAEEATVKTPYRACFIAGTRVATPSGDVAIETIQEGHEVLARPDGGEMGVFSVVRTSEAWPDSLFEIQIGGAVVRCTPNHRFSIIGRGWVRGRDLREGDLIESLDGPGRAIERVAACTKPGTAPTYELCVPVAESYFVLFGATAFRVHNNDFTDPTLYNRVLYWIFGKRPNVRPTDVDGLSAWRTNSFEDARTFAETRVNIDGRLQSDTPSYFSEEQLKDAGISAPETPGDPASSLTGKLPHHSLRPASAPEYPAELNPGEMEVLRGALNSQSSTVVRPRDLKC